MNIKFVFLVSVLFLLTSCVETVVIGAVATGVVVAGDGSVFDISEDSKIKTSINKSFKEEDKDAYKNIQVDVFNGKVMLTGYVGSVAHKTKAVNRVRSTKQNVEVIDEIFVLEPSYKLNSTSDSWISSQISLKMKTTSGIKSGNYKYNVVDGNVFIIGVSSNKDELKKVCDLASRIKGVNKVITYITIM